MPHPSSTIQCAYPYYRDTVISELKELGFYKEEYVNQGLNIQTSLNPQFKINLIKPLLNK